MKEIIRLIDQHLKSIGLDIGKYDESFLDRSIRKRISDKQFGSEEEYLRYFRLNEKEAISFFRHLQINYTDFFRNALTFSVLERIVLPDLFVKKKSRKQKEIRAWSSACSTGQEAYSLAILLEELKEGNDAGINYRIFGTDLLKPLVKRADKGQFSESEVLNVRMKHLEKWFTKTPATGRNGSDVYDVKPDLKAHIDFSQFDLFSEDFSSPPASIFGNFDLIFCANILFYYRGQHRLKIIEKVRNCLSAGGYLVTGEAERQMLLKHNFTEVFPQSAIFQSGEK